MNTYYIFNSSKIAIAEAMLPQRYGHGFFDFKIHEKLVRNTSLPLSSLQLETNLRDVRPVLILETDFAPEDAAIRQAAETESEFFSPDNEAVLAYLNSPDNV